MFLSFAGVPHNGELPYVIGFPFFQESLELRQDARIVDVVRWDEEDQIWALYMMEMWTNFAKFGYVIRMCFQRPQPVFIIILFQNKSRNCIQ